MKIGIIGNCQQNGIAACLEVLLPGAEISHYHYMDAERSAETREAIAADFARCDGVISAGMGGDMEHVSHTALKRSIERLVLVPPMSFSGFHPDTIYIKTESGQNLDGPAGAYQSRLALMGYLAGLPTDDTVLLFNRLTFMRLGYLRTYDEQYALLIAHFRRVNIDLEQPFARWRQLGCFMHTVNHPKLPVLFDIAMAACDRLGIAFDPATPFPGHVPDVLFYHVTLPVLPPVAVKLGIPAETRVKCQHRPGQEPQFLDLPQIVAGSFTCFAAQPRATLLAANGVEAGMATLGLHVRTLA